jgi:hypothetical protein
MTGFNPIGIGICALAFGSAIAIGKYLGIYDKGPLMMIAGPIVSALDLLYRTKSRNGHWLRADGGGALLFIPVWLFGAFWLVLGAVYTYAPK